MLWPIRLLSRRGRREEVEAPVIVEEPLEIQVNGWTAAVLMRLPGAEKELAIGFCIGEGIIRNFADIHLVHHCGQGLPAPGETGAAEEESRHRVQIQADPEAVRLDGGQEMVRLIRSGCGAVEVQAADLHLPPVTSRVTVAAEVLFTLTAAMRTAQHHYKLTGGVHAAALFTTTGEMLVVQEDIGRHNAADKVIGWGLLHGVPLDDKILLTTGRASYELVGKAARVGLPILASISSPTSLAVQLADSCGCTLIGYLRGGRMNVYTHPWRVR